MAYTGAWVTKGFEDFNKGRFGNAGQNIYVSSGGVLQRIHQFDITGNGFVDLVFCNSQGHWEQPPSLVYQNVLDERECLELPSFGTRSGAVADLNGDGFDDLVLGFFKDGVHPYLNAMVYYGSPEGLSNRYHLQLPAPKCTSVAVGDFLGTGKPALAFLTGGRVRIFYQSALGFEMKEYTDLDIEGDQLSAYDLDDDGFSDLIVRSKNGLVRVFWGGTDGINPDRVDSVPKAEDSLSLAGDEDARAGLEEFVADASPIPKGLHLNGLPHIFCPTPDEAILVPVTADRSFAEPLMLEARRSLSVAAGNITGGGFTDLVFACRDTSDSKERSWIYWGSAGGYSEEQRTGIDTDRACDVEIGDLNGNGFADAAICQNRKPDSFTTESLVFRGSADGIDQEPVRLPTHDARRVFIARPGPGENPEVIFTSNFAGSASDDIDNVIYFGSADGFSEKDSMKVAGFGSYTVLYADINDDGHPDVTITSGSEFDPDSGIGSYIFHGGNAGLSPTPDSVVPTVRCKAVACADLNRNGHLDLVFTGFHHPYIDIFYGGPDGFDEGAKSTIHLQKDGTGIDLVFGLLLADLNNDGWLDIVVAGMNSPRAYILWGGQDGFTMDNSQPLAVWNGRNIQAADLSGNGYLDLVIAGHKPQFNGPHDSFLTIYWNGPEGIREDRKMMLQVKSSNGFAIADFNNDGWLDLFAGAYSDGREREMESYIYWNRGGRFSHWDRQCLQTHAVAGCLPCDFNEDGWVDLAVANHKMNGNHTGYSEVWWNGPQGFSSERTTRLPTIGARGPSIVHPGNIMNRGPEETYESALFKLPERNRAAGIEWEGEIPAKTWVKAQIRSAPTEDGVALAHWCGPEGEDSWFESGAAIAVEDRAGPWIQYRLALGAVNSGRSPRITSVKVTFTQTDQSE